MMSHRLKRTAIIVIALTAIGCQASTEPTELMPGIWSRASENEVRHAFAKHEFVTIEDHLADDVPNRPRYHIKQISTAHSHLESSGELVFWFYNDRLWETVFYPSNPEQYFTRLRNFGIHLELKESKRWSKQTIVRRDTDFWGRPYVVWGDRNLTAEHQAWIDKYGY